MIPNTAERECRGEEEEGVGRARGKGEKPGAESSPSPSTTQALYLVYQGLLFT